MLIEIEKKDKLIQLETEPGESVLFAGLRSGIPLPYECATGTCGTCKARVVEGDIDNGWPEAPGKKSLKAERGDFLLCQAHANTPCKLKVPAKIQGFRDDDIAPRHYQGALTNWKHLTEDVIRFDVELDEEVGYHPGQFFVIEVPGIKGYRAYSMINFEEPAPRLEFVLKLKPGGAFSDWASVEAQQQVPSSTAVKVFGPLGRATFHEDEGFDLTMICGGSGVAGMMAILEQTRRIDYLSKRKIRLYFGVRTIDDLFFSEKLIEIKKIYPENFYVNVVLSMQETVHEKSTDYPGITFSTGFVHESALKSFEGDNSNTLIYMAGPQPMVDAAVRPLVLDAQIPAGQIRFDKFS